MTYDHTENKRLYCEDWIETDTPWERWEYRLPGNDEFCPSTKALNFNRLVEYRRIPQTRSITIEVSDQCRPLMVEPEERTQVFVSSFEPPYFHPVRGYSSTTWVREFDSRRIHATAESAEIQGRAMAEIARKMAEGSQK